ncbi:MAG TPA: SDR family oxidoreductase [Cytophagaceae bacterium]|jgi:short-subunit dehydrogenase
MKLKDKVVIITGGSSGIGRSCAFAFGLEGAKIVITGRNQDSLLRASDELRKSNIEILAINADVSLEEDNKRLIAETLNAYGKIDILINNAGISMRSLFSEVDLSVIKKVMDINFYGTVYATKYALPEILKTKGTIVGISSIAGFRGLPGRTGYSASKFAMQGFLEALRTELLHTGVNVLLACPGFTNSNIRSTALNKNGNIQGESPLDEEKMMSSEEVAKEILKGVINKKRDLILTFQGKLTVFLNKRFPAFMDKMVYNHFKKEPDSPIK